MGKCGGEIGGIGGIIYLFKGYLNYFWFLFIRIKVIMNILFIYIFFFVNLSFYFEGIDV